MATGFRRIDPASIIVSGGQAKPIGVPAIDWDHPLSAGLLFYGFDTGHDVVVDLAGGRPGTLVPGATRAPVGASRWGGGFVWNNSDGVTFPSDALIRSATSGAVYTCAMAGYQTATAAASMNPFGRTALNGGSAPGINWGFIVGSGGSSVGAQIDSAGAGVAVGTATTVAMNTFFSAALVINGTSGALYVNAAQSGSTTTVTPQSSNTNDAIVVSGASAAAPLRGWKGQVFYGAFWSRALSQTELLQLHLDPYCFLLPSEGEWPAPPAPPVLPTTYLLLKTDTSPWIVPAGVIAIQVDAVGAGANGTVGGARNGGSSGDAVGAAGFPVNAGDALVFQVGPGGTTNNTFLQSVSGAPIVFARAGGGSGPTSGSAYVNLSINGGSRSLGSGAAGGAGVGGPSGPGRSPGLGTSSGGTPGGGSNGGLSTPGGNTTSSTGGIGGAGTFGTGGGAAGGGNASPTSGGGGGGGDGVTVAIANGGNGATQPLFTDNSGGPNNGVSVGPGGGGGGSGGAAGTPNGGNGGYGAGGGGSVSGAAGLGGDGYIAITPVSQAFWSVDSRVWLEHIGLVRPVDNSSPVESGVGLFEDTLVPVESLSSGPPPVQSDTTGLIESLASVLIDEAPPAESLNAERADTPAPVEATGAGASTTTPAPLETHGNLLANWAMPTETLISVRADRGAPAESLVLVFSDTDAPLESLSTATIVTANTASPVEWHAALLTDRAAPTESVVAVVASRGALIEALANTASATPGALEATASLLADRPSAVDWSGRVATDETSPAEWAALVIADTRSQIATVIAVPSFSAGIPAESLGGQDADTPSPAEWFGYLFADSPAPVQWIVGGILRAILARVAVSDEAVSGPVGSSDQAVSDVNSSDV